MTSNSDYINANTCECYKKLHLLGIPLHISEENENYSEYNAYSFEHAFSLPYFIKINNKITEYPPIESLDLPTVFREMAKIIPCFADFETNLVSFWMLDMFIEGLKTAQLNDFSYNHQKIALLWIAYMFNYTHKYNPTRKDLFRHLKIAVLFPDLLFNTSEEVDKDSDEIENEKTEEALRFHKQKSTTGSAHSVQPTEYALPLPPALKEKEDLAEIPGEEEISTSLASISDGNKEVNSSEELSSNVNLEHMNIILEILYRIFARLWVNLVIQDTFFAMPNIETVELPYNINEPKPIASMKFVKRASMDDRSYHSEILEEDRERNKNNYILPLQASEEAKTWVSQPSRASSIKSAREKERLKK